MASLHPLFAVTAVVLLCGALTGEEGICVLYFLDCTQYPNATCQFKHFQMPKMLFATSKLSVRTAPTSPSPGTLWMAYAPPPTSTTFAYTKGIELVILAIIPILVRSLTLTAI